MGSIRGRACFETDELFKMDPKSCTRQKRRVKKKVGSTRWLTQSVHFKRSSEKTTTGLYWGCEDIKHMSLCLRGILEAAVLFFTNVAGCFAGKDFRVGAALNSRVEMATESYLETVSNSSPFIHPSLALCHSEMDGNSLHELLGTRERAGVQPALLLWSPGQHACWPAPDSYLTATRPWPETRREKTRFGSGTRVPPSPKTLEVVIFQKPLLSPSRTI